MFLYDKKDTTVDVYSFIQNQEKVHNYKIEQMNQIPSNERGLYLEEIVPSFQSLPILYKENIYKDIIPSSKLKGEHISLNYNTDKDDVEDLLDWFYSEKYKDRPVARISDLKKLRYLLIASSIINSREENGKVIMKIEDIIEIPKSLYLLQLLQQEHFFMIKDENLSEQLNLFEFQYIDNIRLDELKKMDICGITKKAYPKIIEKSENDKHILKLLKK